MPVKAEEPQPVSASADDPLASEARAVLGAGPVQLVRLSHGIRVGVTAAVVRVVRGERSAVVKVVRPGSYGESWRGSHDPTSYRYWRREPEVYRVGLPQPYPAADVVLPRLLGCFDRPDGSVSLWLADEPGPQGDRWSLARTAVHARRLGWAQGACAVDGSWRAHGVPWSERMLESYLTNTDAVAADVDWTMLDCANAWRTPLMAQHFDAELREDILRLCAERTWLVGLGARLPSTLCHHDAWPRNFLDRGHATVAIDWAYAGQGWLGADVGNYVSDSALDLLRPTSELPALEHAVFDGYCAGLREAGWRGETSLVRLGMYLMAAKWTWLVPVLLSRALREATHTVYGGVPVDAARLYGERATVFRVLTGWAAQARVLARELLADGGPSPHSRRSR